MHIPRSNQLNIVHHDEGAMLITGAPGSGKTFAVTERIRRLLHKEGDDFRILFLTSTRVGAAQLNERLSDIPSAHSRVFSGSMTDFCHEVLSNRGRHIGIRHPIQLVTHDERTQIILEAIASNPNVRHLLEESTEPLSVFLYHILSAIREEKQRLSSPDMIVDPYLRQIYQGYEAKLRAMGAYDIDDLPMRTYQLFTEHPSIANHYRTMYRYVIVDDAEQLHESDYQVLLALFGTETHNLMMTVRPGYESAKSFLRDFDGIEVHMNEQYWTSKAIYTITSRLVPNYKLEGTPVYLGEVRLLRGKDEVDEAHKIHYLLETLLHVGHRESYGPVDYSEIAVVARNRYVFSGLERKLQDHKIPYYKAFPHHPISESSKFIDLELCMRVIAHYNYITVWSLMKRWQVNEEKFKSTDYHDGIEFLKALFLHLPTDKKQPWILKAIQFFSPDYTRCDFPNTLDTMQMFLNEVTDPNERLLIHQDLETWRKYWFSYTRTYKSEPQLAKFLRYIEGQIIKQSQRKGIGLFTFDQIQGRQFQTVFLMGMEKGTFPSAHESLDNEQNRLFHAITSATRLLYFSYASNKHSPWGEILPQEPSPFLKKLGLHK